MALDVRLYLAEAVEGLINDLSDLRLAGVRLAHLHPGPSCRATPTCSGPSPSCSPTTSWPMRRCCAGMERLTEALARIKVSPLGAAALAGTTFPIDPEGVADEVASRRSSGIVWTR